jgi:SEFIR domain.
MYYFIFYLDNGKEVSFISKFILREIFENSGNNPKYIPVLLPHSYEYHVPSILKNSTIYKMPLDFDNLKRRVFGIEKYKLAPLPATRPKMKPKTIGKGIRKFLR